MLCQQNFEKEHFVVKSKQPNQVKTIYIYFEKEHFVVKSKQARTVIFLNIDFEKEHFVVKSKLHTPESSKF